MKQGRQGDVLLIKVDYKLPNDLVDIPQNEKGRVTVMLGEATGHHHSFYGQNVAFKESPSLKKRFAIIQGGKGMNEPVMLRHQEHAPIITEPGNYEIRRQNEFDDVAWRPVLD